MHVGDEPVDPAYGNITHRPSDNKWAIPWAEDDPGLTAPELWVNRSLLHARDAHRYGVGGFLSIHWRTRSSPCPVQTLFAFVSDEAMTQAMILNYLGRATSPQIGSAHAVAWNISLTSADYWASWSLGQFGDPSVASQAATIFDSIDSFQTPRPVVWLGGPGGMKPGCAKAGTYDFVDAMTRLRPALLLGIQNGTATLAHLERSDVELLFFNDAQCRA